MRWAFPVLSFLRVREDGEGDCLIDSRFWICRLGPASFFALSPSSDREEGENEDQTKERSYDTTYQGVLIHLVLIFGLRWVVYSVVRVDGICQGVKGECLSLSDLDHLHPEGVSYGFRFQFYGAADVFIVPPAFRTGVGVVDCCVILR